MLYVLGTSAGESWMSLPPVWVVLITLCPILHPDAKRLQLLVFYLAPVLDASASYLLAACGSEE